MEVERTIQEAGEMSFLGCVVEGESRVIQMRAQSTASDRQREHVLRGSSFIALQSRVWVYKTGKELR